MTMRISQDPEQLKKILCMFVNQYPTMHTDEVWYAHDSSVQANEKKRKKPGKAATAQNP